MQTSFILFGRAVTGYGLGCALAFLAGLVLMGICCKAKRITYSVFIRTACLMIPLVLLMSRLIYVLANCTYYFTTLSKPALMLNFWDGGYSLMGAIFGACLACVLAGKGLRGKLLDAAAPGVMLACVIERIIEEGTGMGLGRIVESDFVYSFPFCVAADASGADVHAVNRYEAVAAFILLAVVLILFIHMKNMQPGDLMLIALVLFGCTQVVLESLRDDGHMVVHFVRIQQVLAIILPVVAAAIWTVRNRRKTAVLSWFMIAAGIGITIWLEFKIDHSENVILDYCLMILCMAAVAFGCLRCRGMERRVSHGA